MRGTIKSYTVEQKPIETHFLKECYAFTATRSQDQSTRVGVMIMDAGMVRGSDIKGGWWVYACNSIREEHFTKARLNRPEKYIYTEHAERAAIYKAAKKGLSLDGAKIYGTWIACPECARAIILSGIAEMVRHVLPEHSTHTEWAEKILVADKMLRDSGVNIVNIHGTVGERSLFNGSWIDV